jgi:Flp pilus assembly protein TadG
MSLLARTSRGAYISEFAVVCVVAIPILMGFLYAGWELCQYFTIKAALDQASMVAARGLVTKYNATGVMGTKTDCLTQISGGGFVVNANQFTVVWDVSTPPTFVKVTAAYPVGPNSYGLNPFPNPDIFGIGALYPSFTNIYSNFTMPVQ